MTEFVEAPSYVCWDSGNYAGTQDFDNIYLGIGRTIKNRPIIKVAAILKNDTDTQLFMLWWAEQVARGVDTFLMKDVTIFGLTATFGVRQTKPLQHTTTRGNKITFEVEVLFDSTDTSNEAPIASSFSVSVDENSTNNYIELRGTDAESDMLAYEIKTQPQFGTLSGTPPALAYTPDAGYSDMDSFTYVAKDVFNESLEATVTIDVGGTDKPDAQCTYTVTADLIVVGNYLYDNGDGHIMKGVGGAIVPVSDTITIWSNDHTIGNPDVVATVKVDNWGIRDNYEDFLANHPNITAFTVQGAIGTCKGRIFTRMFKGFPLSIPLFDTSNGIYFQSMFEDCTASGLPALDVTSGIYFQGFLKGSSISSTQYLQTLKGEYFQEFAMNSAIKCVGGLNTINKINTLKMFDNTPHLVNPDTGWQADILQGLNQPFISAAPCVMTIDSIEEITPAVATIDTIDGTAVATGVYKVHYLDNVGAIASYVWTVTGGTIDSGQNTDEVTVSRTIGKNEQVIISCVVTDTIGGVDSGNYQFTQTANYTYTLLDIPKQYAQLNLRAFIDANNPTSATDIVVTNSRTNCSITSGDLAGLNVKLVVTGRLEGFRREGADATLSSNHGLVLTSALELDNSLGVIAGCGGHGGDGGRGANDTYKETVTEPIGPRYSWGHMSLQVTYAWGWHTIGSGWRVKFTDAGDGRMQFQHPNGALGAFMHTHAQNTDYIEGTRCTNGFPGDGKMWVTVYAGNWQEIGQVTYTRTRDGGSGGIGGKGVGYGVLLTTGSNGGLSSPSGGKSGGKGGNGSDWGVDGNDGADGVGASGTGKDGFDAGKAIVGSAFLKAGSIIGTTLGAVE